MLSSYLPNAITATPDVNTTESEEYQNTKRPLTFKRIRHTYIQLDIRNLQSPYNIIIMYFTAFIDRDVDLFSLSFWRM